MMSEGFGMLSGLEKLDLSYCQQIQSLPDSESPHSESFYFHFMMSEGFGQLASLQKLDLRYCPAGRSLRAQLKDNLVTQGCKLQV